MKNTILTIILILTIGLLLSCNNSSEKISLEGEWSYRLDRADIGEDEKWHNTQFSDSLTFPGSLNINGIGDKVTKDTKWTGSLWNDAWYTSDSYEKYRADDNTKIVFWLTPEKYYVGTAWYQKTITIPENWEGKSVVLNLERCHWETTVWVGSKKIETQNSLSVPHLYDLGDLAAGCHTLTLRVDNRLKDIDVGSDAHSISDNTQSNWNGVVGQIYIAPRAKTHINSVKIYPDFKEKKISAVFDLESDTSSDINANLSLKAVSKSDNKNLKELNKPIVLKAGTNIVKVEYDMNESFKLWDEFNPNLYELTASLHSDNGTDIITEQFGLRDIKTKGTQITINDRPVFFRGTLECCIFPKTGFPPTDMEQWERIMKICKEHGLNHIRFHSWCPPKAAFEVADKLGVYLYVETSAWASDIGSGKPIDEYIYEESERIITEYGNHPSFILFAYGNEPHGENHKEYLRKFVSYWKDKDNRFLYTTASGWPAIEENDWHCLPAPRLQGWAQGLKSVINSQHPNTTFDWTTRISKVQPTIAHEIGQWCVYPNLEERKLYDGVLKAKNFDIFEDRLRDNGLLSHAHDFLMASGKLQTLCYKTEIEAALRTEDFGGFQLLDLHDFPGQGTALVGVLDPFWNSKPYVNAQEYSEFCNQVVPLAKMEKFVFSSSEILNADIDVAAYCEKDIVNPNITWQIVDKDSIVVYSGKLSTDLIKTGEKSTVGRISQKLERSKADQLQLIVTVNDYTNRWNLWVYPDTEIDEGDVLVADEINSSVIAKLKKGGSVLLTPKFGTLKNEGADSCSVGFSSIFWNTLWTNGQAPHTLGILCDENDPALELFPTQYHSDYQWWDAMSHSNVIPLKKLGIEDDPIVRIIDDWFTARSFAMIVEMNVGGGKLILCGVDLLTDQANRLEARELQKSLLNYMNSTRFNPKSDVELSHIKKLFK
ncbi:MAG: glycoside hydrolase family 2 TIM barrel-domain containing protein [Rikenellaceae bacterium]